MKTLAMLTVSILTLAAARTAPAAEGPAWCSGIGNNRVDGSTDIKDALDDKDPRNALRDLVGQICKPDAEAKARMKDLEAGRQKWSQRLDLTDAEWVDVADYAT